MAYAEIDTQIQRKNRQQLRMLGINRTDNYTDGELIDCTGISTDRYPYITTVQAMEEIPAPVVNPLHENVHILSVFAWEKLFMITDELVEGAESEERFPCWYGGTVVGYVSNPYTEKQYAVVNSKLVVWPDKVYFNLYDLDDLEAHPLDTAELITRVYEGKITFLAEGVQTISLPTASLHGTTFTTGDVIMLKGCVDGANDRVAFLVTATTTIMKDGVEHTVIAINLSTPLRATVSQDCDQFPIEIYEASDGKILVPDMDYICSHDNRLWGCSTFRRTIYASALGDPASFDDFDGLSTDSYAVAVGSAGDFTGCVSLNNSILFMKQHCIHKLLGAYPAEYQIVTYQTEGASESNGLSAVNCNETAMFVTEHGIGSYYGATTGIVSRVLNLGKVYNALGGFNGEQYFLYCEDEDDNPYFYTYDMRYSIWTRRDYRKILDIVHLGYDDYVLMKDDGYATAKLYKLNSGNPISANGRWSMTFKTFYETLSGSYNSQSSIFEKKRYWNIYIRMELPKNSTMKAEIRPDDGSWEEALLVTGAENAVRDFIIMTPRCDRLQLRLSGTGPMTILAMEREFTTGSRR